MTVCCNRVGFSMTLLFILFYFPPFVLIPPPCFLHTKTDQAHQRSDFHLQPPHWPALPQDHSHVCVGWSEASRSAGQVEDCRRSCCLDSLAASGGAAQTDCRDAQGYVGSSGGALAGLSQHCHQGLGVAAALPGLPEGKFELFLSNSFFPFRFRILPCLFLTLFVCSWRSLATSFCGHLSHKWCCSTSTTTGSRQCLHTLRFLG